MEIKQYLTGAIAKSIILLFILTGYACKTGTDQSAAEEKSIADSPDVITLTDEQLNLAEIRYGKLEERNLSRVIHSNGKVEATPQGIVSVSLPLDAYVRKIHVYSGSAVNPGDILAIMHHPEFLKLQQEYLVTRNDLALLENDLERQRILAEEDAASEKKLMNAETRYANALVRNTALKERLRMLGISPGDIHAGKLVSEIKIVSPLRGFVRKNFANTGELIPAGDPILELEDKQGLHLHLILYEKDIHLARQGQEVEFTTGAGDRTYRGKIYTVGRSIDDKTRSADVHVHILNPDDALLSGMYAKAKIMVSRKKAYALPETAVITEGGLHYVFVREGNSFHRVEVDTGMISEGYVEILYAGPLLEKELVTTNAYYLNAGFGEED